MSLHSDNFNEHLLYASRLDNLEPLSEENPQEAPAPAAASAPPSASAHLIDDVPTPDENTFVKQYLSRIITAILALALIAGVWAVFILFPYNAVHAAKNDQWNQTLYWTSALFVLIAVPVSAHGIVQHLVNVSLYCVCKLWFIL